MMLTRSERELYCILDDRSFISQLRQKIEEMKLPTFPFITATDVTRALLLVPLDPSLRDRFDKALSKMSDGDGRINFNTFQRTVQSTAVNFHARSLAFNAGGKLICWLVIITPIACAAFSVIIGSALACFEGWHWQTG